MFLPLDDAVRVLLDPHLVLPRCRVPRLACPLATGLLCLLLVQSGSSEEWNRFRGPNGSGVSAASGVPTEWTEQQVRWKVRLPGIGHGSPVIHGEKIFVGSGEESSGRRILECRRATNGERLWERSFAADSHRKHKLNSFASATPAVDDQHVYWCWATPEQFLVVALDHEGQEVWRRDLGPYRAGHGDGMSPIVVGDRVIVANEQQGPSFLVALERSTGEVAWKVERESQAHWSTPCVRETAAGRELIFTNWAQGITALDLRTGKLLWQADVFDKQHYEAAIGSPVVAGEMVLGVCGYLGRGNEVIAVRPGSGKERSAEAAVTAEWRISRGAPLCTTPLVVGSLVFLWADNGVVTCAELDTGKVHWQKRVGGQFYSSPVAVGERIYNINTDGQVEVLAAARSFKKLATSETGEGSHSTLAVAGESLIVRTFHQLLSIGDKSP